MPNLSAAKKALRQNKKRAAHNKKYKNKIKKLTREMGVFMKNEKREDAAKLLPSFYKAIDKASKRNILHKNTASRRKAVATRRVTAEYTPSKENR